MSQLYARIVGSSGPSSSSTTTSATTSSAMSTSSVTTTTSTAITDEPVEAHAARREDAAVDFALKRDALLACLSESTDLVTSLSNFSDARWTLHYPHDKLGVAGSSDTAAASSSAPSQCATSSAMSVQEDPLAGVSQLPSTLGPIRSMGAAALLREMPRRAASLFGEHDSASQGSQSVPSSVVRPSLHMRAATTMTPQGKSSKGEIAVSETAAQAAKTSSVSHPLAIDLRLGAPGQSTITDLMDEMAATETARLLHKRFDVAKKQLDNLTSRVRDNQSRILITGDLNAGKSTFVNALLRRDILPTDQQPMTTVFCEVLDAQAHNDGVEEVHAVLADNISKYSREAQDTFERFPLGQLQEIATSEEQQYGIVKVYLEDARAPIDSTPTAVVDGEISPEKEAKSNTSFIRNGIVSISLIDGPGLNKDNYSTTALFTRQTEIDVIVFVLQAQDGFTLSASDFVRHASMDKALVFVVVNKYKNIRDKVRCERRVMQQLRLILPKTWEQREELVHFVEAGAVIDSLAASAGKTSKPSLETPEDVGFAHLEESLRSFLLLKRSVSKLAPAQHYLANLLADLAVTAEYNIDAAAEQAEEAEKRLAHLVPIHEQLKQQKELVDEAIGQQEEETIRDAEAASMQRFTAMVDDMAEGGSAVAIPAYPGLWDLWDWAGQVKIAMIDHIEAQLVAAEEYARTSTIFGVNVVQTELAARFLPVIDQAAQGAGSTAGGAASALPPRVFNSSLMFSARRRKLQRSAAELRSNSQRTGKVEALSSEIVKSDDIEVAVIDCMDLERLASFPTAVSTYIKSVTKGNALLERNVASILGMVSLGAGTVSVLSTQIIGIKSLINAITAVCEVLGSKAVRKWAAPIAATFSVAFGAYLIYDMPRAIPVNIGRKLHVQLAAGDFAYKNTRAIVDESRKVMRLAGFDLRERFRAALDASERDRKEVEDQLTQADKALDFLDAYLEKIDAQDLAVKAIAL